MLVSSDGLVVTNSHVVKEADEIAVTLFVTSVRAITLPRRMWMGLRDNIDPAVAALSVVLIAIVTLVMNLGPAAIAFEQKKCQPPHPFLAIPPPPTLPPPRCPSTRSLSSHSSSFLMY